LKVLQEELKDRYPRADQRRKFETKIEARDGTIKAATRDAAFHGLFLSTQERKAIVQFRPDGFTFNQLGSYTTADDLIKEALDLWSRYVQYVQPDYVIRLALRYINRFNLPIEPGEDFGRFLMSPPILPPELPRAVGEFLTRFAFRLKAGVASAPPELLLDIDVFREATIGVSPDSLKESLLVLRELKNRVFFSLLTDETVRLFE
jgi:uncharacterized protein (TIGR04255 family)